MPARRDYTPEELRERLERRREQTRQAVARHRQRRVSTTVMLTNEQVSLTPGQVTEGKPHPPTPPVLSALSTRELERRLEPFAGRGYRPDPGFLSRLAAAYPGVDLELEVAAALDWLEEPRNARRRCSKGFLKNWCAKADQDRKARDQAPASPSSSPKGVVVNGTWHPPAAFQRNPGPPPGEAVPLTGPLERIGEAELRAVRDANRHLTLAQKAARLTNGTSPTGVHKG